MNIQPSYTPAEVMKVIDSVIAAQRKNGYKPGWIAFEMKRRSDNAITRLHAYMQAGCSELPGLAMEIATGEMTRDEAMNWLTESWDYEQSHIHEIEM